MSLLRVIINEKLIFSHQSQLFSHYYHIPAQMSPPLMSPHFSETPLFAIFSVYLLSLSRTSPSSSNHLGDTFVADSL